MPFPSAAPKPVPTPAAAPAYQAPAPQAPGAPPSAPAAPAVAEPKFWVGINGASQIKTLSEMRGLSPVYPAMTEDQSSGWLTVGAFLAKYPTVGGPPSAPAPAPAAGGFAGRAAPTHTSQAGVPNNLFAGMETTEFYRKNANMTPGEYVAKVTGHVYKQGQEKNMLIIELEILVSSFLETDPTTHGALREGVRAAAFVLKNKSWLQNTKEVIIALSGFDAQGKWRTETDTVTQEEAMALVDPSQPYSGALVYVEAKVIKTQTGGDFTLCNWWPMPVDADGKPDFEKLRQVRG